MAARTFSSNARHLAQPEPSRGGLTAFLSMTSDGSDNVVTAIMKARMVPSWAPLPSSASATGIVPKIALHVRDPKNQDAEEHRNLEDVVDEEVRRRSPARGGVDADGRKRRRTLHASTAWN